MVGYNNMFVSDGISRYPLLDWKLTWQIDDESNNLDRRFGWLGENDYLYSLCGHDEDSTDAKRTVNTEFHLSQPTVPLITYSEPHDGGSIEKNKSLYHKGDTAVFIAHPSKDYKFENWTENNTSISTSDTLSFIVSTSRSLFANFIKLVPIVINSYSSPLNGGIVEKNRSVYYKGDTVVLIAKPSIDYKFQNWTENNIAISSSDTLIFVADKDRTISSNFMKATSLSVYSNPIDGGIVEKNRSVYYKGDTAVLIAKPSNDYKFQNWSESNVVISKSDSLTFIVNNDRAITANFSIPSSIWDDDIKMESILKHDMFHKTLTINSNYDTDGILIYDLLGNIRFAAKQIKVVNLENLPIGVYIVSISLKNENISKNILIVN